MEYNLLRRQQAATISESQFSSLNLEKIREIDLRFDSINISYFLGGNTEIIFLSITCSGRFYVPLRIILYQVHHFLINWKNQSGLHVFLEDFSLFPLKVLRQKTKKNLFPWLTAPRCQNLG